ncbi:hypothetical protein B0T16DRAFT_247265 [Cercophora newfieldiana]|uniref:Uncharacterized protein n=1 Tax=Cercophora newfieldiana TaxID=92897 RepID=A0AA39XT02_9PEZI|nr:hypothetical protein B0T16DRAFT_247265 [Cercophora newfieldiana]
MEAWDGIPSWLKSYLGGAGKAPSGQTERSYRWAAAKKTEIQAGQAAIVKRLQQAIQSIKAARLTRDVWGVIRNFLVRCIRMALHYLDPPATSAPPPQSAHGSITGQTPHEPSSAQYYGILIQTPPVHGYGSFSVRPQPPAWDDDMCMMESTDPWDTPDDDERSTIPWQSTSASCIPSMMSDSSLTADTHLSVFLVEKNIWESASTTLITKLTSGRYWDIRGQDEWRRGEKWCEDEVKNILAVEILGLVHQGQDGLDIIDEYNHDFDALRSNWEYRNISWNDVDFAILLGALMVVGPGDDDAEAATSTCRELFYTMGTIRLEQFLVPRAQLSAGFATAVGVMAILGTGGLAAPLVGPMMLGKLGAAAGMEKISRRDRVIWDQRLDKSRDLAVRFPQLRGVVSV